MPLEIPIRKVTLKDVLKGIANPTGRYLVVSKCPGDDPDVLAIFDNEPSAAWQATQGAYRGIHGHIQMRDGNDGNPAPGKEPGPYHKMPARSYPTPLKDGEAELFQEALRAREDKKLLEPLLARLKES